MSAKRKHLVSAAKSRASKSGPAVVIKSVVPAAPTSEFTVHVSGLRLVSPNSQRREHWAQRSRRVKAERSAVAIRLFSLLRRPSLPVTITLVHIAPRRMDSDNSVGACKGVRDEVALWLGVDDGDSRITWHYAQQNGPHSVLITMEPTQAEKKAAGGEK